MASVTAVRAVGPGRVDVEIDGSLWRRLPAEPVVRAGLREGTPLERATLRSLRRELRRHEALAIASRLLRSRDRSAQSLEARLSQAGVAPAARREAMEVLQRGGILDDRRFAASRAAALAERGYGDDGIRLDLERAGVSAELREEAVAALAPEVERAVEIVKRRRPGPRMARFLAGKGFGEDAVETALGGSVAPEA